jgi:hypothetical protein
MHVCTYVFVYALLYVCMHACIHACKYTVYTVQPFHTSGTFEAILSCLPLNPARYVVIHVHTQTTHYARVHTTLIKSDVQMIICTDLYMKQQKNTCMYAYAQVRIGQG